MASSVACGIDFGTSNSAAAVAEDSRPHLVCVEGRSATIPSALFFDFERNSVHYGRDAVDAYVDGTQGRFLRALKSILGSTLIHEKLRIKSRAIPFVDIVSMFIGHLKRKIEEETGHAAEEVVLGRPVHFVDNDPGADRRAQDELQQAARRQGFRDIAFQYEPIAAALDYEQQVTQEEIALIVDIGGGTSDFSVVRVSPQRAISTDRQHDILANAGVHVGGTDFDRVISLAKVMPHLGYHTATKDVNRDLPNWCYVDLATWHRIPSLSDPKVLSTLRQIRREAAKPELVNRLVYVAEHRLGHRLASKVEDTKIILSNEQTANLSFALKSNDLTVEISRQELEGVLAEAIQRILSTIELVIADSGVTASQITAVCLTGGSVSIPSLRQAIVSHFPSSKIINTDLFGSVALGLALDARRKFGSH